MPEASIRIGSSGWSYKEWEGVFYPPATKSKLHYYSFIFNTAEIDSTFYSYPSRGLVHGWSRGTAPDFVFSAKLPRVITHEKSLNPKLEVETDLHRFLDLMQPLRDRGKLGPLLIQLPPSFKRDCAALEGFLQLLPAGLKFACEFRHPSWWREETWSLLRRYNVANVIVDEPLLPPDPIVTADFAFIRWHGRGRRPWYYYRYSVEELKAWTPRVKRVAGMVKEVYGYYNNHFRGYAVANALQMLELLQHITPKQREAKSRVLRHLESPASRPLTTFDIDLAGLEGLLPLFIDRYRLERARHIKDAEISELSVGDDAIHAKIRGYELLIDLKNRTITHDCDDWEKRAPTKELCKHVAKILITVPQEKAEEALRRMATERGEWRFVFEPRR